MLKKDDICVINLFGFTNSTALIRRKKNHKTLDKKVTSETA